MTKIQFWASTTIASTGEMITPLNGMSEWKRQAVRSLVGILSRRTDWDSYGSPPPSPIAVANAIQTILNLDINYFLPPQVAPVGGGGVQLEWNIGSRGLELEFGTVREGSIEYLQVENGRPIREESISVLDRNQIRSLLLWVSTESERPAEDELAPLTETIPLSFDLVA